MEMIQYVERNKHGSMIIIGTDTHVSAVGFAHEGGTSEEELLEWFHLSKEQLYGALAYFYGNRDGIVAVEDNGAELAKKLAKKGTEKLNTWRSKQDK